MPFPAYDWRDYSHVGWIPTTTGHLSFSNIGRARKSAFSFNPVSHPACGDHGKLCVMQWRTNQDAKLPLRILGGVRQNLFKGKVDPANGKTGFLTRWMPTHMRNAFLLIGEVGQRPIPYLQARAIKPGAKVLTRNDPRTAVFGEIVIFRNARGLLSRLRSFLILRRAKLQIANANTKAGSKIDPEMLPECGLTDFARLRRLILIGRLSGAFRAARVSFMLLRTGEVRLRNVGPYGDEHLMAQAYLFIKDMAHVHHHHKAEDDQHLPLIKLTGSGDSPIDDITWRKRILWALAKTSGQFRREDELFRRRQSAGFIAYAEAFQRLLGTIRRIGNGYVFCPEIATYDFSSQRQSIATKNEDEAWRRQGRSAMIVAAIAATLTCLMMYISISGLIVSRFSCLRMNQSGFCNSQVMHPLSAIMLLGAMLLLIGYAYNSIFAVRGRINLTVAKYAKAAILSVVRTDASLAWFSLTAIGLSAVNLAIWWWIR